MRRFQRIERAFHHRVHYYISNSFRACEELSEIVPSVKERSLVLLNAIIPPTKGHLPRKSPGQQLSVAMLGNILMHKKGYDILLDVGDLIVRNRAKLLINVAGRDDSNGEFERLINARKLSSVINYIGPTSTPLDFLASNDAYLLLSRYEGVPNALLEAMSLGMPCVSTDVGDTSRLFRDGEHLRILNSGNAAAAYDALLEFQRDWSGAIAMGHRACDFTLAQFSFARLKMDLAWLFQCSERL